MRKITSLLLLAWLALAGIMSAQDLPFTPTTISGGKFVGGTQYYYINLSTGDRYLYIDGDDVKWTATKSSADQFAITGNTTDGFKIYKKGDTSKLIYLQNTTENSVDNVYYGASETNNSWTLVKTGSNQYYSFYQTGPCTSRPTEPCTLNYHAGSTSVWTWTYPTAPGRDDCKVTFEMGDVEPAAERVNLTYKFNLDGVTSTKVVSAEVGAEFPDLELPAFCVATKPEGTVSAEDGGTTKEISVDWNGPFNYTSSVEGAKWYLMTLGKADNGNLPVVRYNSSNNWITLEQGDNTFKYAKNDQWAFVGNPFAGFKIYNRALENGRLISSTTMTGTEGQNTFPYVSSAHELSAGYTETWDIYEQSTGGEQSEISGGFAIGQHGTPANKINRRWQSAANYGTDFRMAYWTGGSDNGSTFTVSQTSLPDITLNTVDGTSYASFYVDYPVKVESENVKVYTGTIHGGRLDMTVADDKIIPANVGVVLISETAAPTAELSISNEVGTLTAGDLTGTTTGQDITGSQSNYLVLGRANDDEHAVGFYRPTGNSIPGNRAFIYLAGGSVQGLAFNFDGETTGLNNISTSTKKQEIYDLSGRRVMKANKGLYIINGKKCFIK